MKVISLINLKKIISNIFRLSIAESIFFVWCRYYFDSLKFTIVVSILLTLSFDIVYRIVKQKIDGKNNLKAEEAQKMDNCLNAFLFNDAKSNLDFFLTLALSKHVAHKTSNYIVIESENKKNILYPHFAFSPLDADELLKIITAVKQESPNKLIVCTNILEPSSEKLAASLTTFNVILLSKNDVYLKLLKPYDKYPTNQEPLAQTPKLTLKQLFVAALSRKKAKSYLFCGLLLLFSSFIVRFSLYYLIFSTILLTLSLIAFTSPRLTHAPNNPLE